MWQHPRLRDSIVRAFKSDTSPLPRRALQDSILQAANEKAYMRELGRVTSASNTVTIPQMARETLQGIESNFGAALNFNNLSIKSMTSSAPFLLRPKTFSYKEYLKKSGWNKLYPVYKVQYDKFNEMPSNKGLISEVGLYNFQPTKNSWIDWNAWVYDSWHSVCKKDPILCLRWDARNHVRVRYRAFITPDPLEHSYFKADSGAVFGEIHSSASASAGIIGHQLIVQADVSTTEAGFFTPQVLAPGFGENIPAAVFGIDIINLTTNRVVKNEHTVNYGDENISMEYTFPDAGLYQVFVYLKSTDAQGIMVSSRLTESINKRQGRVNAASHPLRFLIYVSSPPNSPVSQDVVVGAEEGTAPVFTTETETIELVDNSEGVPEVPSSNYLVVVGILVGALLLVRTGSD